jgi:tripartite-type tricarboxylate transporter receptor subunit TctC
MKKLVICLTATACAATAGLASAQNYPNHLIRIIAPFAPGGGTDFIARVAAQKLTESLGQPVIVDNRPGAGGVLGADLGAKAAPDGYTFTLIASSYAVNPSLFKLTFDPINDITPVIQLSQGPFMIVVHPSLPVKTVKELIALAKAKPNQITYASAGTGSSTHLATELFDDLAGIKMIHVPYKGTGPAISDVIAGHVQVLIGSIAPVMQQIKAGRLRAIAVSTPKRIDAAPDVPTVMESGIKDYNVILWHGIVGPKSLPRPIVDRINGEANKILQSKEMQDKLAGEGVTAAGGTPEKFAALIKSDITVWERIIRKANIKAE